MEHVCVNAGNHTRIHVDSRGNEMLQFLILRTEDKYNSVVEQRSHPENDGLHIVFSERQISDPIDCLADGSQGSGNLVDTYCWIISTYTLPHLKDEKPQVGGKVVAPGVGPYTPGEHEVRYHTYYQWVPFMLFLQGAMFYLPHWLWKNWEDGKIRKISDGLRGSTADTKETKENQQSLVKFILDTMHMHNNYAACYYFCELLNFINVIGNIFFVDEFLGGAFLTYGTDVINYMNQDQENRTDPMIVVFPRVTKCHLEYFGVSGTPEFHDFLCVLPVNIFYEKIYIFLWFWFIILSVLTAVRIIYSISIIAFPPIRKFIIERRFKYRAPSNISSILDRSQLGDFLLLHLLGRNMSASMYHNILEGVSDSIHDTKPRI
ncbi:hypothetical protein C0J52_11878 [Blattella germanica]|nr:hypothetical protein C0J52_11878 [Blattella germanica]